MSDDMNTFTWTSLGRLTGSVRFMPTGPNGSTLNVTQDVAQMSAVIAAFLAKKMDARLAAAAGAVAHGRAAELAPHQVGLVASDVIDSLPLALG